MVRSTPYTRLTSRAMAQKELFSARLNLMLGGKRGHTASRLGLDYSVQWCSCGCAATQSRQERGAAISDLESRCRVQAYKRASIRGGR